MIPNESRLREQPPSNGNVKGGTPKRQVQKSFHRQETLEKNPAENAKKLVEEIGLVKSCPPPIQEEKKPKCQWAGVIT